MKNQPLILPLAGLVSGIFLAEYLRWAQISGILLLVAVLLGCILMISRKPLLAPILSCVLFCLIGVFISYRYNHFSPIPEDLLNEKSEVGVKIIKEYKPSEKYRKYKVLMESVNSEKVPEVYALLYSSKDLNELYSGDRVQIQTQIRPTLKAMNPHQFDYSKYLKRDRVHYTLFTSNIVESERHPSLAFRIHLFKKETNRKLLESGYSNKTAGLVSAMLLGDRTETDDLMVESFRKTGVVHILAISGLHVMMVFSIFMLLLYPITEIRNGKYIRIWVGLIMIWAFAGFVGFKPPVFRSVLMISIYYITILLRRPPNVYHTLILTALILLFLNPNSLFDVGFQLSFSAVFFIVYLNPIFQRLFKPKGKFKRTAVAFLAATLGAQLGTFPFSAHYFNQTSGLFLAGNLIMIPASYYMIIGGMISLTLVWAGWTPKVWIFLFDKMNDYVTTYIEQLATFKPLVFEEVSIRGIEVLLIILILIFIKPIFVSRKFKYLSLFFLLLFIFQVQRLIYARQMNKKEEIVVFHQPRSTLIGVRKGPQMDVFLSHPEDSVQLEKFILRPYKLGERVKYISYYELTAVKSSFYVKSSKFISLDQNILFINPGVGIPYSENDFILIRENSSLPPNLINERIVFIADGSNYPDFNPGSENLDIWRTAERGAKIIRSR